MNKMKLTLEALALLVHLLTGVFMGYLSSMDEAPLEVTNSIFVTTTAMFLLWGLARLQGKYLFWEIESVLHGALAGVVLGFTQTTLRAMGGEIAINPVTYWLVGIGSGLTIGIIYGKFGEMRTQRPR